MKDNSLSNTPYLSIPHLSIYSGSDDITDTLGSDDVSTMKTNFKTNSSNLNYLSL